MLRTWVLGALVFSCGLATAASPPVISVPAKLRIIDFPIPDGDSDEIVEGPVSQIIANTSISFYTKPGEKYVRVEFDRLHPKLPKRVRAASLRLRASTVERYFELRRARLKASGGNILVGTKPLEVEAPFHGEDVKAELHSDLVYLEITLDRKAVRKNRWSPRLSLRLWLPGSDDEDAFVEVDEISADGCVARIAD